MKLLSWCIGRRDDGDGHVRILCEAPASLQTSHNAMYNDVGYSTNTDSLDLHFYLESRVRLP